MSETKTTIGEATEKVITLHGIPLRLSFEPSAIRDHFGDCEAVQNMTDAELAEVGYAALCDDFIYGEFNNALRAAFEDEFGFDPDNPEEDEVDEEGDDE
jgi:hypothetical protein